MVAAEQRAIPSMALRLTRAYIPGVLCFFLSHLSQGCPVNWDFSSIMCELFEKPRGVFKKSRDIFGKTWDIFEKIWDFGEDMSKNSFGGVDFLRRNGFGDNSVTVMWQQGDSKFCSMKWRDGGEGMVWQQCDSNVTAKWMVCHLSVVVIVLIIRFLLCHCEDGDSCDSEKQKYWYARVRARVCV